MNGFEIDSLKRRAFLKQGVTGLGLVALNSLLTPGAAVLSTTAADRIAGSD